MNPTNPADVPIFILCGGLGTRLREQTEYVPKPMLSIGSKPIVWHIMQAYSNYGFRRFVLCLGYRSQVVKDYFLNYHVLNSDSTVYLAHDRVELHASGNSWNDWEVTLAYTGEETMTGARVAIAAARYLGNASHFGVTYGDGLTDANLLDELHFHLRSRKVATVLGVNPPSRFGEFMFDGDELVSFSEKPNKNLTWINGGYFFFRRDALRYLDQDPSCVLERAPLANLAGDRQLAVFQHHGYWACMDTQRDFEDLNRLWATGKAPWAAVPGASLIKEVIHENLRHRA